ncbi:hypothetical protein PCNPT3_06760 [Psychromonas sp. CNPT3]|uniref:peptidoglycan binding protein CsiV n=1 Tax=Psychromonas sp. CNPT3 TaxID=314282 RepID=UPI0002C06B25|nr:peptidoglycan binding protein CsiV [Psychromonas sp. CNPT3]AGH81290.1 hypothetical protein PCNPT3_06760 [Psychromonas sp. CNPT3]
MLNSLTLHAQTRWFEVELLLFERNVKLSDQTENLGQDNIKLDFSRSIPLLKIPTNVDCTPGRSCLAKNISVLVNKAKFNSAQTGFVLLSNSRLQLAAQRLSLKRHWLFKPLLHAVWRMPVYSRNNTRPLRIFAGKNLVSGQNADIKYLNDKWEIDGNLKIYLAHYLYVDSQLIIRKRVMQDMPTPEQQEEKAVLDIVNSQNGVQIIRPSDEVAPVKQAQRSVIKEVLFDQNRRMRSGEIHYFDHPLMGMLIQIRKIKA